MLLVPCGPIRAAALDGDVKALLDADLVKRGASTNRIQEGGAEGAAALLKGLDSRDGKLKIVIVPLLEAMERNSNLPTRDADIAEFARRARREKDAGMRNFMLTALARFGGPAVLPELERSALDDRDAGIRLAMTDDAAAQPRRDAVFFEKKTKDADPNVRLIAYEALAELGNASGREVALQTLNGSANEQARESAIWILGLVGNPADAVPLKRILESPKEEYMAKFMAIQASKSVELHQLPEGERTDFFMKSLDDPSPAVRDWAGDKLVLSSDPAVDGRLNQYLSERGRNGYEEANAVVKSRRAIAHPRGFIE